MSDLTEERVKREAGEYDLDVVFRLSIRGAGLTNVSVLALCTNVAIIDLDDNHVRSQSARSGGVRSAARSYRFRRRTGGHIGPVLRAPRPAGAEAQQQQYFVPGCAPPWPRDRLRGLEAKLHLTQPFAAGFRAPSLEALHLAVRAPHLPVSPGSLTRLAS